MKPTCAEMCGLLIIRRDIQIVFILTALTNTLS